MAPVHRRKPPGEKASGCSRIVLVLVAVSVVLMVLLLKECARASAPERRASGPAPVEDTTARQAQNGQPASATLAKPANRALPLATPTPARPSPSFTCETFPLPPRVQRSACDELVAGSNAYTMSAMGTGGEERVFAWYRAKFTEYGIDVPLPASGDGVAPGRMTTVSLPDFDLVLSVEPAGQNQIRIIAAWRNGPPPSDQREVDTLRRLTTNMLTTLQQAGKE